MIWQQTHLVLLKYWNHEDYAKPQILRTINNTNGYRVTDVEVIMWYYTVHSKHLSWIYCQFVVGEKIFVNIGIGTGNGFNSPDNGFEFFEVVEYNNTVCNRQFNYSYCY